MTPQPSRTGQTTASVSRQETPGSRRAWLAQTHQALIAPVHTLIELAGMMLADARERGQEEFRADLEKIHSSGRILLTRFHELLDPEHLGGAEPHTLHALRHDLRTPLTHILGYCELWIEDAEMFFLDGFVEDLRELHALGQRMLARLDEIVRLLEYRVRGNLHRDAEPVSLARRPRSSGTDTAGETGAILIVDDDDCN